MIVAQLVARLSGVVMLYLDFWLYHNLPHVDGVEPYQIAIVFMLAAVGAVFGVICIFAPKVLFCELWGIKRPMMGWH
jgi:hypothetical protein